MLGIQSYKLVGSKVLFVLNSLNNSIGGLKKLLLVVVLTVFAYYKKSLALSSEIRLSDCISEKVSLTTV